MHAARQKKPAVLSAGILLYRRAGEGVRVLLGHPGGPFFARKDAGAWSIPKGLVDPGEPLEAAARREFEEELGWRPEGELAPLGEVRLSSGKRVTAFALLYAGDEAEALARFAPGRFTMEWPPRSGALAEFPEVDRIAFFDLPTARDKITLSQRPLVDRLEALATASGPTARGPGTT
jgi:predicted NUDIX family NTP pyrophosphohydrolase